MITEDRSMTILIILIMAERAAERIWVHVTHLDGKLTGARELMLKSIGSYSMATKASGTLALII